MKKTLIVGQSGTIGNALYTYISEINPNTTYGTSHRAPSCPQILPLNLATSPLTWPLQTHTFDTAYLSAGICRMNLCEEDKVATYKINVEAMSHLAKHLSDQGTFIVYLSTNQVFSGEEPYTKATAPYQPNNEYGRQKAGIENFIQKNCEHHAIVRLTKVVEPNMALLKNWKNQLNQSQSLNAFYDMPLAPISLRQVITTLSLIGEKKQTGIYQMSGESDLSYYDLAILLAKKLNCDPQLVRSISAVDANIPKNFLPRFTTLDCSSTIALGGELPPTIETVLQECLDF